MSSDIGDSAAFSLLPTSEQSSEVIDSAANQDERLLMQAVKSKNNETIVDILNQCQPADIDLNRHILHTTYLCSSASNGFTDICRTLLTCKKHTIDIDRTNACGETPLLLSIKNSHLETADLLISYGAKVNIPEPAGTVASPLFNAVWKEQRDLVWMLVNSGSDVNIGSSRNSPLLMAARLGCVDIAKLLLEAGCDKNWQNRFGVTALYESVIRGNLKVVEVLLEGGCDSNLSDKYGKTPLHVLAQEYYTQGTSDNVAILQLLLSDGSCDVTKEDKAGDRAGDLAVLCNKPWVLRPLLLHASQINSRVHRLDALSVALHSGLIEVAKILLQAHVCHEIEETAESLLKLDHSGSLALMLLHSGVHLPSSISKFIHIVHPHLRLPSLQSLCRIAIRVHLKYQLLWAVERLSFPKLLKKFLLFETEMSDENWQPFCLKKWHFTNRSVDFNIDSLF